MTSLSSILNSPATDSRAGGHPPTPEQLDFIEAIRTTNQSLLLDAVAGSGKTTTLVMAIGELPAELSILALAFNTKIKDELASRLPSNAECLTMNGLGHRAWCAFTHRRNMRVDPYKVGTLTSDLCKSDPDLRNYWGSVKDIVGKAKSEGIVPQKSAEKHNLKSLLPDNKETWLWLVSKFDCLDSDLSPQIAINMAREVLTQSIDLAYEGTIDFDDQVYMTVVANAPIRQYSIVFVDEAQDLSPLQHEILARCVGKGRLIAVGDPHQSIYGFRGAAAQSIPMLVKRFNLERKRLTFSFRCGKSIIKKAQRYVPHIQAPAAAAEGTVSTFTEWRLTDLKPNSTILCRNVAPLVGLAFKLVRNGISANLNGADIGAPIKKAAKKISGTTIEQVYNSIKSWELAEQTKAANDLEKLSRIEDIAESLRAICTVGQIKSAGDLQSTLDNLFDRKGGSILLSSIHKAKGLEWDTVYFLDPDRIPSKYATRAAEANPDCLWMVGQENNLAYIAITRAKKTLTYLSMGGLIND